MIISTIVSIAVTLAAIIGIIRLVLLVKRVTIFEYERGIKYVKGRFAEILEPGSILVFCLFYDYHENRSAPPDCVDFRAGNFERRWRDLKNQPGDKI